MSTNQEMSQSKWMVTLGDLQERQNQMKDVNNVSITRSASCKTNLQNFETEENIIKHEKKLIKA